jgi:amino acid permease
MSLTAILSDILGPYYRRLADVLLGFYAWGGGISFLMLVGGEQKRLADHWGLDYSEAVLLGATVLIVVLPLSMLRSLDRYARIQPCDC